MEGLSVEALGVGGVLATVVVGLILWKLVKVAIKVVLFLVLAVALAGGVGLYLKQGKLGLPVAAEPLPAPAPTR